MNSLKSQPNPQPVLYEFTRFQPPFNREPDRNTRCTGANRRGSRNLSLSNDETVTEQLGKCSVTEFRGLGGKRLRWKENQQCLTWRTTR